MHVNVWDKIQGELDELMNQVSNMNSAVRSQDATIEETEAGYAALDVKITKLTEGVEANSVTLA